ncbi:rubredoxin [Rhodopseudomonas palustris]|uniref:Rubredoxin n=1 Tax=Rhodopseudomonas palustris (strain BisB18) TaxID=316056 RepID=Q20ZY6_RHOPB
MSGFENFGKRETDAATRMECGICWTVYDPAEGDPHRGAEPGTPFSQLPEDWSCPNCDAPAGKFMRLDDAD